MMRKHIIPLKGGEAVYHARTLYALINDSMEYDDENICTAMGYRLKQKETNNGFVAMEVSPNPAKNYFDISWNSYLDSKLVLKCIDVYGKCMLLQELNAKNNTIRIQADNLSNGMYQIVLFDNNEIIGKSKIVVSK